MTITCHNYKYTEELNSLIENELQHEKNGELVYHKTVEITKRGIRGIRFTIRTAWNPDYNWLDGLLDKYPHCWIKNYWREEGGTAGIWIGFMKDNVKDITHFAWQDLCIEEDVFLFLDEEEEKYAEEEHRTQNTK
jgi:hypothetical protein